ncbi:ABC transporter ATP-binding protein [Gracilibacillus phocaeensis]|uniref:ABC transporter ATP-binding protein n=1 Tax=Gracilibacillus phocaeensis TaxID=2042304 RepID=UPI0010301891|nr:ABC transporter ATP-binding protein [Gracilibacillus phocaeensis]
MTLIIDQLNKTYGQKQAVHRLNLELAPGQTYALLGPNGAGKTTTLRMISGLIKPTAGTIRFDGIRENEDLRRYIGYLPQYPHFHGWMSGREFLIYVGELSYLSKEEAGTRADRLLEKTGIAEAANKRINTYSGGMRQRLGIAQAMIHQPRFLLLDEPVSSLDPVGRRDLLNSLEELKTETTILFSTHILSDAEEISDSLIVMNQGRVVEQGTLETLRKKYQRQVIDLHFTEASQELQIQIKSISEVTEVHEQKGHLVVEVTDVETVKKAILQLTLEQGWSLDYFSVHQTSLEEMFMEVIGHETT